MTSVAPAPRKQFELPPHGALVYIPELFAAADGMLTRRIRVLGQLVEYSPADDLMIIEYGNQSLLVDTKLLDVFSHRLKSIYQLIGDVDELETLPDVFVPLADRFRHKERRKFPVLRCKVLRCVDGLDVTLYGRAMDIFRDHFQARGQVVT